MFSQPPWVSDPDMHHDTCVTHVPWCMQGSLTSSFLWSWWRGKRSRHSRCMRNPQFYVSGKRPITREYVKESSAYWFSLTLHLEYWSTRAIIEHNMNLHLNHKNIEKHTAHTIVSWPNPKQWKLDHTCDLMMIIRQSVYSLNHHKENGWTENTKPHIFYNG